jgi:hypothetical protein
LNLPSWLENFPLEIPHMKKYNLSILLVWFLIMTRWVAFPGPLSAQTYSRFSLDADRIQWDYLVYEVKSTKADVTTAVRLEFPTQSETTAALIKSTRGDPVPVPANGCHKITVHTIIDSLLHPPIKSVDHLWFDPQDATALGRESLRRGDEDFKKVYRFTKQGVFRNQREPKNQKEASYEPDQWTKVIDTFYSFDADRLGCPNIVDRLLVLYIVSASGILENNQPLSLCVFGKRQLFHVKLQPAGSHSLEVNYVEKMEQGENRRQGRVKAIKIDLEAEPLESDLETVENFSLMGFLKKISFSIDPARNFPVEIRGEIPPVGGVTLKLKEARLRKIPS